MSRRQRRRQSRQGRQGKGRGIDSLQGISPKQMQKAMGQIDTNEISDVQEVLIRTSTEEIVLSKPEVTVMNMGQEIWNIIPGSVSRRPLGTQPDVPESPVHEISVKEDDIKLIMTTVQVSREEAENAIKKSGGDIAAAIMSLK